jgi:hypothetical protein
MSLRCITEFNHPIDEGTRLTTIESSPMHVNLTHPGGQPGVYLKVYDLFPLFNSLYAFGGAGKSP